MRSGSSGHATSGSSTGWRSMVVGARVLELESGTVADRPGPHPDGEPSPRRSPTAPHDPGVRPGHGRLDPARVRSLPHRHVVRGPALRPGRPDRDGAVEQVVQTKMLDYFFSLRTLHRVAFQPIVELTTWSSTSTSASSARRCRCSPSRSRRSSRPRSTPTARSSSTCSSSRTILERAGRLEAVAREAGKEPRRYAHQPDPGQPARPGVRGQRLAAMVRDAGLAPPRITIECTEQQSVPDLGPLKRQVKALRKARASASPSTTPGAGYASFALVAALRPTIIKIDREITHGIAPRRCQAGAGRGVRLLRPADRREARRRGDRDARGPCQAARVRRRLRPGLPAGQARRPTRRSRAALEVARSRATKRARVPSRA